MGDCAMDHTADDYIAVRKALRDALRDARLDVNVDLWNCGRSIAVTVYARDHMCFFAVRLVKGSDRVKLWDPHDESTTGFPSLADAAQEIVNRVQRLG